MPALKRLPCWQCALHKFLTDNGNRHFAYGSFDCCLFVCDAVLVMTGTDIAAQFRGKYSSLKEARRFGSVQRIIERVAAEFTMPEVPLMRAHRGDLVLIRRARDYSLGIVDLSGKSLAVAVKIGVSSIPLSEACRAWRI